jgi:hypothetical protein
VIEEVKMNTAATEPLHFSGEELAILRELLESERDQLLVEIRHTDHRLFREELRHRLSLVEQIVERCRPA